MKVRAAGPTAVEAPRAEVADCACQIDGSGGEADFGVPLVALVRSRGPAYATDQIPPAKAAIFAVNPGIHSLA